MEKNAYPVLKNWTFTTSASPAESSKELSDKILQELRELEDFISGPKEKITLSGYWSLRGNVFGREKFPDNSVINTNNLVEIEKTDKNPMALLQQGCCEMLATTKSGSKYLIAYQEMDPKLFVFFGELVQEMGYL